MKYIIKYIRQFIPKDISKPVGRWGLEKCNIKINQKIDLANEDNCGPCGQYALEKLEKLKISEKKTYPK
jgi:hypothetical protein